MQIPGGARRGWLWMKLIPALTVCKGLSENVLIKRIKSAIHNQILNNDRTIVSCVYEPLLSRQTESVRDHKFHSGYAHSSMDRGHFISHLHHTQE